jgi:anti-sigma factor RsiW
MNACNEIRPWLEWLAADELEDGRRRLAQAHLRTCPACSRELAAWRSLLAAAAPDAALDEQIRDIDWDGVTARVMAGVEARPASGRQAAPLLSFAFLAAAAVLVVLVGLGVFFRTRSRGVSSPRGGNGPLGEGRLSASAATRLQSGLAREEAVAYLQESQLMLTDLLDGCVDEEMAPGEIRLYSRQAKQLLLKKKYFRPYLSQASWAKVRSVSERIDWLNYEILQLDERQLCGQIGRLQKIMEDERLLLKIRLAEKELAFRPYQEV